MKIENNLYMPRTAATEGPKEVKANSNLSIDDLMKIIAAELSNQPLTGSDGGGGSKTDYVGQLAQITMMEQMSEINEGLTNLNFMGQHQYAFGLIGKEVTLINPDDPENAESNIVGVVDKVKFQAGYAVLEVNGKEYPMGAVQNVGKTPETLSELDKKLIEFLDQNLIDNELLDRDGEILEDSELGLNSLGTGYRPNRYEPIEPLEDLKDLEDLPVEGDLNE